MPEPEMPAARWRKFLPRSRRGIGVLVAATAFAAAAFGLGWFLRPPPSQPSAVAYGMLRLTAIAAHLGSVKPPYVLLAGDSYMELYTPEPLPCGREIVNAGVGGAKAGDIPRFLDHLPLDPPPSAVLLSIGLNNLLKKLRPSEIATRDAFRDAATTLVRRLGTGGAKVVVIAIPPVPEATAKHFDLPMLEAYDGILRQICQQQGCRHVDVFADARDGEYWRAKPGLAKDGLHLADLRRYYRRAYPDLCR
jgi:lysophospholipase L1-like esterase